jgi:hypothetical protein
MGKFTVEGKHRQRLINFLNTFTFMVASMMKYNKFNLQKVWINLTSPLLCVRKIYNILLYCYYHYCLNLSQTRGIKKKDIAMICQGKLFTTPDVPSFTFIGAYHG